MWERQRVWGDTPWFMAAIDSLVVTPANHSTEDVSWHCVQIWEMKTWSNQCDFVTPSLLCYAFFPVQSIWGHNAVWRFCSSWVYPWKTCISLFPAPKSSRWTRDFCLGPEMTRHMVKATIDTRVLTILVTGFTTLHLHPCLHSTTQPPTSPPAPVN